MDKFKGIFLDIDGVLNNATTRHTKEIANFHSKIFADEPFVKSDFNFHQDSIDALNALISSISNPMIIISSDWRFHAKRGNFHDMFEVVGIKYTPLDLIRGNEDFNAPRKLRSELIMNYIYSHSYISGYCAIDDRKELFSDDFTHVVFTDDRTGLQHENIPDIIKVLNEPNKHHKSKA